MNGKTSDWVSVSSGVPEGSLVAPLLFSLFINDLPREIDSNCLMYADDVKIYRKITAPADGLLLQRDLDRLQSWSVRWGLILNPAKCHSFTMTLRRAPVRTQYSIGNAILNSVDEIRDLGVILDSKLTFSAHISHVVRQANRSLGLLIRSFQNVSNTAKFDQKTLLTTYYANVRSHLEYCSVIWAGAANSHSVRVDRVQHKFLLWLNHHTVRPCSLLSYESLLDYFGVPSLKSRRIQHDLLFLKSIYSGKIDSQILLSNFPLHVPARSTRMRHLFAERRGRVSTVSEGLLCRIPRVMNTFLCYSGADIFFESFSEFKAHVLLYVRSPHAQAN